MVDWVDPGLGDYEGMNPDRVRHLLFSAAQMAHTGMNNYPAWLFAGEVFRVGPKVGMNLCMHAGLDPSKPLRALRADIAPRVAKG
ncbi:hypothetical protein DFR24_1209 [Panacagrimonas perspica]|uniref:Uncharacterized protein n=1 Tax=Panacagrimonas perspica TaxID=381431 RepID=A0A4R7PCQ9_9GAMM|nr:hypothetical protein DFR24_1209 [Panacagrimonas perspica]THD02966.1 hypothetical protein B1810_10195 [Panacagrimonas perspica]